MDWKTTKNKDNDSLKKLIENRYGVKATTNASGGVTATVNGKTYNWSLDKDGNPTRSTAPKVLQKGTKTLISLGEDDNNKSIAPQKQNVYTIDKAKEASNKVNTLKAMQQDPKNAGTIAQNSFTGAGNTVSTGAVQPVQQTSGFSLIPTANANYDTGTTMSKTERQNEEYRQKQIEKAKENIQQFLYDTDGTKKSDMKKLNDEVVEMINNGVDYEDINNRLTYNGYKHQNTVQKGLDWVGGGLNKIGDAITVQSNEDDGLLKSAGKFLLNIPGSALGLVGDTVETVSHPWETAKQIGDLADTGFDYLNYAVTGDPLMDKSKATGEAIKNINIKEALVENPADILSVAIPGGGALANSGKLGKVGNVIKNVGTKIDDVTDVSKLTKYPKNLIKGYVKNAYEPEKIPGKVYDNIKPKKKTIDDLKKEQVDVASYITRDKYIDTKEKSTKSSDTFMDFSNEKTFIRDNISNDGKNKAVEGLKETLKDVKIDKNTTYNDLRKQLGEKEIELLDKQIEIASDTPTWSIKDFEYESPFGETKNRMQNIIDDIKGYINENDTNPQVYELANTIKSFENGEMISELQLLKMKRFYNSIFRDKYLKEDKATGNWELKNPTSKYGQNFDNNQQFLRNILAERDKYSNDSIRQLDVDIHNIKTFENQFKDLTHKVRGEKTSFKDTGVAIKAIDLLDKIRNRQAKISQFFMGLGWDEGRMTYKQSQSMLKKNVERLYKLEEEIKKGGKSESWYNKTFNKIDKEIQSFLDDKPKTKKVLKTSGKILKGNAKNYKATLGVPQDILNGIQEKEIENKYMK